MHTRRSHRSSSWRGRHAIGLLALLACAGCGGGGASGGTRFDFENSAYTYIVLVPLDAYRAWRPLTPDDNTRPLTGLFNEVQDAARTATDRPFFFDWDLLLAFARGGMGDSSDTIRYYLAYEVVEDATSGECTVFVHVFEGLPRDPDRPSILTFAAIAAIGETDRNGQTISSASECASEAGWRAGEAIRGSGLFDEGWSKGPPSHLGG